MRCSQHDRRPIVRSVASLGATVAVAAVAVATIGGASERAGRPGRPTKRRAPAGDVLVRDSFSGHDRLVTNEYAYRHPRDHEAAVSPTWQVTSGSLFVHHGFGWTGVPDGDSPGPRSGQATGSAVFRMQTRRSDLGDVAFAFDLRNLRLSATERTPARARDGVHVLLRWRSPAETYYASVDRRDGFAVIKKKVPGGPSNGGTYFQLGRRAVHLVPLRAWEHMEARVRNGPRGSVVIRVLVNGRLLLRAVDRGQHGRPLSLPGRVGIRGDNDEFLIANVVVRRLR